MPSLDQRRHIDQNINILHALLKPGSELTQQEIAEVVGCTQGAVYLIERKAMRKLRKRLAGLKPYS